MFQDIEGSGLGYGKTRASMESEKMKVEASAAHSFHSSDRSLPPLQASLQQHFDRTLSPALTGSAHPARPTGPARTRSARLAVAVFSPASRRSQALLN